MSATDVERKQPAPSPLSEWLINEPVAVSPLDLARRLAKATLEHYKTVNVHDRSAMNGAAEALGSELVRLLAALDAEERKDAGLFAVMPEAWRAGVPA